MKVSQRVSELQTQTVGLMLGWSQFTKGHKTVDRVIVLNFCISSDDALYLSKFQENISKSFRIIEQMPSVYRNL